jgi:hypothetical protein
VGEGTAASSGMRTMLASYGSGRVDFLIDNQPLSLNADPAGTARCSVALVRTFSEDNGFQCAEKDVEVE